MAIPRFSFGSGASGLYNPNQILVPTTLTSADKTQLLDYDKKIADYKAQVDAYNKAVEDHNKSGQGTFSQKEPTDPGITQKEIDTFGAESAARAQQLQTARQNALNIIQNPEGFSSYYGIGSLGFEEGGEVPVNFVGTGEFPEALNRAIERLNRQAELTPIEQNSILGTAAKGIKAVRDFGNKATVPDFIPLVGGQGVGDLFVGQAPEEIENLSYGNYPFDMPYQGTGGYLPRVKPNRQTSLADTVFLGEGLFPAGLAVKSAVKGATPKAAEMLESAMRKTGGIMDVAPSGPRTVTRNSPSLDTLKAKPEAIAPDADVARTRELVGIDDADQNSIEAWKKQRKDEIEAATGRRKIGPSPEDKLALVKQARLLDEGKISTNDFRTFVDTNFPYYFHEAVPEIKSMKENALALGIKVNKKGILGLNRFLPEGAETQIRFDVNAYENANVYTSTIYEGFEKQGKLHSYAQTGALKDVTFPVDEKLVKESKKMAGIGVDTPKDKSPVVRMKGYWVEHSPEELREIAMEALEQNKNLPLAEQEWVQVGINPAKGASWVALEKTADGVTTIPITGASEVIQIGKLVLARKPKLQSWDDYYKTASFEEGGAVSEGIGSLMQDNRYQEAKVFDLDYAEDAERYNSRKELEQLNPSFMVGRYNIRPNISGSYQSSSVDIPENVDGKNVFINKRYKSGGGNLGFNVTTPNQHNFGAGASGNYFTGSTENPEEIQAFGAPAKINYGEGLTPQNYYAYYNTPEGLSISGNYQEENPEQERQYRIMLSKEIKLKNIQDLTNRIARLFTGR